MNQPYFQSLLINTKPTLIAFTTIAATLLSASANAQTIGVPIIQQPGTYQNVDVGQIEKTHAQLFKDLQAQDQQDYQVAQQDLQEHFADLLGTCGGSSSGNCSGFMKLKQLSSLSGSNQVTAIPIDTIRQAIFDYETKRETFLQSLGSAEVVRDVWNSSAKNKSAYSTIYQRGSLDLKALTDTYRTKVKQMDAQARNFTYLYNDGVKQAKTLPGNGLIVPEAAATPAMLAQKLEELKQSWKLDGFEVSALDQIEVFLGKSLTQYEGINGKKFVWLTPGQKDDKTAWINSIQNRARILSWVRGVYCLPLGVPSMKIPDAQKFNIDLALTNQFSIEDRSERSRDQINVMLSRLDRILLSLQSKSGQFNGAGGVLGWANHANSMLTWQNQVDVNLNTLKVIREMLVDELDLLANDGSGCERVRSRYTAKYKSFKDASFKENVLNSYMSGISMSGNDDPERNAYEVLGRALNSKGVAFIKYRKMMSEQGTAIDEALKDSGVQ